MPIDRAQAKHGTRTALRLFEVMRQGRRRIFKQATGQRATGIVWHQLPLRRGAFFSTTSHSLARSGALLISDVFLQRVTCFAFAVSVQLKKFEDIFFRLHARYFISRVIQAHCSTKRELFLGNPSLGPGLHDIIAPPPPTTTNNNNNNNPKKSVFLCGFFRDFRGWGASCEVLSRISEDGAGAYVVRFCPGFPVMGRIV